MKQEEIYNFIFNKSTNSKERFKGLNFFSAKTFEGSKIPNGALSHEFIDWIGKKSELAKKLGISDQYDLLQKALKKTKNTLEKEKFSREYSKKIKKIIDSNSENLTDEYVRVVEKIHSAYSNYLNRLFLNNTPIKYVIIAEAPMLTLIKDKEQNLFDCKYIFSSEHPNIGNYRKVPYKAICEIENEPDCKEDPEAVDIINLFINKRVLFLDLIALPLPQIKSELRKNWSINTHYFIEKEPRVVTFLRCSLDYIFTNHKPVFNDNVKIALMMPSNSALGIINFYSNLDEKTIEDPFKEKIKYVKSKITRINTEADAKKLLEFSLRLHRQVAIGSQGGPEKELLKHALSN
jgi:hypothetical protein